MTNDTCKNCGGWKGIHHYETGQCPINGKEAPLGQKEVYTFTKFEPVTEETTPATKAQLDALIEMCKEAGYNEAAGLLQLGSNIISEKVKESEEPKNICWCFEIAGDNLQCPTHGKRFSDAEIQADYQERSELYYMGMGA